MIWLGFLTAMCVLILTAVGRQSVSDDESARRDESSNDSKDLDCRYRLTISLDAKTNDLISQFTLDGKELTSISECDIQYVKKPVDALLALNKHLIRYDIAAAQSALGLVPQHEDQDMESERLRNRMQLAEVRVQNPNSQYSGMKYYLNDLKKDDSSSFYQGTTSCFSLMTFQYIFTIKNAS